jgi:hypothetical protein
MKMLQSIPKLLHLSRAMRKKFQSFSRPGSVRITPLPSDAIADEQDIFRLGDFETGEQIQGVIFLRDGDGTNTEFTGEVVDINDGRIQTFKTTSPNRIIPELSGVVRLTDFDFYEIRSIN